MTGVSLGLRTGSYGSLQLIQNGNVSQVPVLVRRASKTLLYNPKEKERSCLYICRHLGRGKVAMLLMLLCGLFIFVFGCFTLYKGGNITNEIEDTRSYALSTYKVIGVDGTIETKLKDSSSSTSLTSRHKNSFREHPVSPLRSSYNLKGKKGSSSTVGHQCDHFAFPPPPPADRRRTGPRPCPVCYIPVEQAIASMPSSPSESPVLRTLTYAHNENMFPSEPEGGSDFGGYPPLEERDASFDIKETMKVHCGFVKGSRPGRQTGFDFDEEDLLELDQYHDIIVASAIFGNYDVIQQPRNISKQARKNIPFYMFIDEETEMYMRNASILDSRRRVGLWRIIVVRNIPYADSRRNGKIPKLLLHRIFPNIRYSIWIDGKLELVKDPYQILERFLWRPNATFAISRHYRRFDVFVEAEANKVAGKYENASIDRQVQFYQYHDGLTHYSRAKLPITSDVPEGCVIIREHIPITNLFTCLWFNEVDRFTSRDQLSFSTVRDKIMAKVDWSINMFLDCERRNFVIQAYHRDVLENMPPPPPPRPRPVVVIRRPRLPPVPYTTNKPALPVVEARFALLVEERSNQPSSLPKTKPSTLIAFGVSLAINLLEAKPSSKKTENFTAKMITTQNSILDVVIAMKSSKASTFRRWVNLGILTTLFAQNADNPSKGTNFISTTINLTVISTLTSFLLRFVQNVEKKLKAKCSKPSTKNFT